MTIEQIKRLGEARARQIYNNIKATHNLVSVCNITAQMLGIVDTDRYCYVMTYSFPCQDLSPAGNGYGIIELKQETEYTSTRGKDVMGALRASMHKQGERNLVENLKNGLGYEGVIETGKTVRVRKLTERECFRLMAVKDKDFDKIAKHQSKSALYHEAGDSIVAACMMALFGAMVANCDYRAKIQELITELSNQKEPTE